MWINKYFELMYSKNSRNVDDALKLKNSKIPNSLYKYKRINEYTWDLLNYDLIFLPNANELNDPYEGEIFYDEQEYLDRLTINKVIPRFFETSNLSSEEKNRIINSNNKLLELYTVIYEADSDIFEDISFDEFYKGIIESELKVIKDIFDNLNKKRKNDVRLVCFSKSNKINPMWAHYANEHKGICIEYDIKDSEREYLLNLCCPIKYEDNYDYTEELCDIKNNYLKILNEPLLKKSTEWEYEKEWRILFNHDIFLKAAIEVGSRFFLRLPKPKAIYLGINIGENEKKDIINVCKKREIALYPMEMNKKNHKLKTNKLLSYSKKNYNDEQFIIDCIENKNYCYFIKKYFFYSCTKGMLIENQFKILNAMKKSKIDDIQLFLDRLLFKDEVFPVLYNYYPLVLSFLIKLYEDSYFSKLKTSDGLSIVENLKIWLSYCISNFYGNKIVRYMIFYEKLFFRFFNHYVVLNDEMKKVYELKLSEFDIKNKYFSLIKEKDNDNMIFIHPLSMEDMSRILADDILKNLEIMIKLFYVDGKFNEEACYKNYLKLEFIVNQIEKDSEGKYREIFENSKDFIPFDDMSFLEKSFDIQLSSTCSILNDNQNIFSYFSIKDKQLLQSIGAINNNYRIANFIDKCCDKLNLDYNVEILTQEVLEKYFNPKTNPYEIL